MELANIDVKSKEISGNVYYVRAMPPLKALELLGDLQAVITTGMKGSGSTADSEKGKSILDRNIDFGTVIAGVGDKLRGPVLASFANRIIDGEYVSVKRSTDMEPVRVDISVFNNLFTGKLKQLFQVIYFVLEVNFADFFEDAPSLTGLVNLITKES